MHTVPVTQIEAAALGPNRLTHDVTMELDPTLRAQLLEVLELNRIVKPAEAQGRLEEIMRGLSESKFRLAKPLLVETINAFLPKRERTLTRLLENLSEQFSAMERAGATLNTLVRLAEESATAIESTNDSSAALRTLLEFKRTIASACVEVPDLRTRLDAMAISLQNRSEPVLRRLFEAQVARHLDQIRLIESYDIDSVLSLVRESLRAASDLSTVLPSLSSVTTHLASSVSGAAAVKIGCSAPIQLVWRTDVVELVRENVGAVLDHPEWQHSAALAAAILSNKSLLSAVERREPGPGIVHWACELVRYSESAPRLDGLTRFNELSEEDIVLAGCYSNMPKTQQIIEQGIRSLDILVLELDEQEYRTFLVKGVQPRIAELAFGRIAQLVTEINGEVLVDLNLQAVRARTASDCRHYLPSEDFAGMGRRFDVKCNLFFRSREESLGLRGFQVNISGCSENAEVAAVVVSGSSDFDANWSFIGFAPEAGLQGKARVAPYCFSLPDLLSFQNAWMERDLVQAMALVDAAHPEVVHGMFGGSDRYALLRSMRARKDRRVLSERTLWDEVTAGLMRGRCRGGSEAQGAKFLAEWQARAASKYWLFPLAKVGGRPLLDRWITEVLTKLNLHWDQIRCPNCGSGGQVTLVPSRITDAGTVLGEFQCGCGAMNANATLVTHCWDCGRYPLIIGESASCGSVVTGSANGDGLCYGLRCSCGGCRCNRRDQAAEPIDF